MNMDNTGSLGILSRNDARVQGLGFNDYFEERPQIGFGLRCWHPSRTGIRRVLGFRVTYWWLVGNMGISSL